MTIRFADHLKNIPEYVPGKPVEELERELGIKEAIKMASNENFWGPSPKVREAILTKVQGLNVYPDPECFLLRRALSKRLGVEPDQILVSNGSNYLIDLIARSILNPGEEGITCDPTFALYQRTIKGALGVHRSIPLNNFDVDIEALLRGVTGQTRLIFLASPNNPTGKVIPLSETRQLMKRLDPGIVVVLDEAYIDFVKSGEAGSGLEILKDHPNLVILRTFSKMARLAGLRIGYGVADAGLIRGFLKLYLPFSVGTLAQAGALAFLQEEDPLSEVRRINEEGKEYFYREFKNLGLEFVPTEANFILLRVGNASRVYEDLLRRGVIVRDMTPWKLPDHLRITISLPEHNERLVKVLRDLLKK